MGIWGGDHRELSGSVVARGDPWGLAGIRLRICWDLWGSVGIRVGTSGDPRGDLWGSVGSVRDPWASVWASVGACGGPWGICGDLWDLWGSAVSVGIFEDPWGPVGIRGDLWGSVGDLWGSVGDPGYPWGSLRIHGVLTAFSADAPFTNLSWSYVSVCCRFDVL